MKDTLLGKLFKNHSLAMILCCAIPLGLLVVLSYADSLGSWGYYGLLLLCPLMHVVMMRGHGHHSASGAKDTTTLTEEKKKILLPAPEVLKEPQLDK